MGISSPMIEKYVLISSWIVCVLAVEGWCQGRDGREANDDSNGSHLQRYSPLCASSLLLSPQHQRQNLQLELSKITWHPSEIYYYRRCRLGAKRQFTYDSGNASKRRTESGCEKRPCTQGNLPWAKFGDSYDEFPFASTKEGGKNAQLRCVDKGENHSMLPPRLVVLHSCPE